MPPNERNPYAIDARDFGLSTPENNAAPTTQLERLRTCLLRYIRPIMVDSALKRAEAVHGKLASPMDPERLANVVEQLMMGLRMFVKEEQLPHLMIDLAEFVESEEKK